MDNQEKLLWRFDVSTFKLLGRELITDRITAVYELVKNCYDANATHVNILFSHIANTKHNPNSCIIIRDNGVGMSIDDIKNKWMVVGTSSKRARTVSPPPFKRRYIGEKGVGRFAVDKLGGHLHIRTRQATDIKVLNVIIDWSDYERKMKNPSQIEISFQEFTAVENEYYYEQDDAFQVGTELRITMLHEAWDRENLGRLSNQLSRILSPTYTSQYSFTITLQALEFDINDTDIQPKPLEKFATYDATIPYDEKKNKQGSLKFNEKTTSFEIEWIDKPPFGFITMKYYFFDTEAIKKLRIEYPNQHKDFLEGVKIYRDGVICTPFAENTSDIGNRRDILGIDKRRYVEAFDKMSNRELYGIIEITKDNNPDIIDATNRQDFVDNEAYIELKKFIIKQLDTFVMYRKHYRTKEKQRVQNNLKKATSDIKSINKEINQIAKNHPALAPLLTNVINMTGKLETTVTEGVKEQVQERKEFIRKENIYLSLMSLQDYATNLAHAIRLSIGKIKRSAEFFKTDYPNPSFEQQFIRYASVIFDEMQRMSKLVDFMLSYAQVDLEITEFSVQNMLTDLFFDAYTMQFEAEEIDVELEIKEDIQLIMSKKFIEDVLENLIANSIKALQKTKQKKIKCACYIQDNEWIIIFSDNGMGIKKGDEEKVFEVYYTTTAEQGGAGLGLYIAEKRMEALKGSIVVVPSIYAPDGASFKLTLPLNKSSIDEN